MHVHMYMHTHSDTHTTDLDCKPPWQMMSFGYDICYQNFIMWTLVPWHVLVSYKCLIANRTNYDTVAVPCCLSLSDSITLMSSLIWNIYCMDHRIILICIGPRVYHAQIMPSCATTYCSLSIICKCFKSCLQSSTGWQHWGNQQKEYLFRTKMAIHPTVARWPSQQSLLLEIIVAKNTDTPIILWTSS